MASETVLHNGHYHLKLPFKKPNVSMPNRQVAEQRLQGSTTSEENGQG